MPKIELKENQQVGNEIRVTCRTCNGQKDHKILAGFTLIGNDSMGHCIWEDEYQIIQCQGCKIPAFRKTHSGDDTIEHFQTSSGFEQIYHKDIKIYPDPDVRHESLKDEYMLSKNLRSIYAETLRASNSDFNILTTIGIRCIVETVCKEKGVAGKDLEARIKNLVEKEIITPEDAKILHQLRNIGNNAAHEIKKHSRAQIDLAMEIIKSLLERIYISPQKAETILPKVKTKKPDNDC